MVVIILFFLFFSSCSSEVAFNNLKNDPSLPGNFGVGVTTVVFFDRTRVTPSTGVFPEKTSRTLITEVWYPSQKLDVKEPSRGGQPSVKGSPFPLIVFSHGAMAFKEQSSFLCKHLASYGYIVLSPDFPLTSFGKLSGRSLNDVLNQPADISFIIDSILDLSDIPGNPFYKIVDGKNIGLTGHSLGGLTTLLSGIDVNLSDNRIKAVAPISPFACMLKKEFYSKGRKIPILFIGGDDDRFANFEDNDEAQYQYAYPDKYLIRLIGGTHVGFLDIYIKESIAMTMMMSIIQASSTDLESDKNEFLSFMDAIGTSSGCKEMISMIYNLEKNRYLPEVKLAPPKMEHSRQMEIARIIITSFFNYYLKGQSEYLFYLSDAYDNLEDDIDIKREVKYK